MSRLLVVDASVVCSASETDHPVSAACRRCLEAIRQICHRVALTDALTVEWGRHQSRFTRKWRRSMAARKKPLRPVPPSHVHLSLDAFSEKARVAITKDLCLLSAALSADRIIVTRDDSLQLALQEQPEGRRLLKQFRWINPLTHDEASLRAL